METSTEDRKAVAQSDIKVAMTDALKLLGNSIYQISRVRRKRVLKACNPDMANLAGNNSLFKESAPQMFGAGFEKNIKERAEALKVLHKSGQMANQQNQKFFSTEPSFVPPKKWWQLQFQGERGEPPVQPHRTEVQQRRSTQRDHIEPVKSLEPQRDNVTLAQTHTLHTFFNQKFAIKGLNLTELLRKVQRGANVHSKKQKEQNISFTIGKQSHRISGSFSV